MTMLFVWLGVFCAGLLVECTTAGTLVSIWFSVGAVIPFIMSCFGINHPMYITAEIVVFGVVTILCLIFLRKISKKLLFRNNKNKTNLDIHIGKKYTISKKYGNDTYIKFNGIEYAAYIEGDDEVNDLELGDKVEIIRFQGNKAIVKMVEKKEK